MTEKMIIDAYCRIRTIDQTIPDDVLDFMKNAAIERIRNINQCECNNLPNNEFAVSIKALLKPFGELDETY